MEGRDRREVEGRRKGRGREGGEGGGERERKMEGEERVKRGKVQDMYVCTYISNRETISSHITITITIMRHLHI